MKVALTGGTGFIGSHVLAELREHGHEVLALVHNEQNAAIAAAAGATPVVVDLHDSAAVARLLADTDATVHTASTGDAATVALENAVIDAVLDAYEGTGKAYVQIGGLWAYGENDAISEESPFDAPALVGWKEEVERRVLEAKDVRSAVIVSSVAYGDGGGAIPGLLLGSPRDEAGNLVMAGSGRQRWSTVHVADLAVVFRRVLENDSASGYYVVGDGANPTVAELTEAAAVAVGAPGAVPGSDEEIKARVGDHFAEVLLISQGTAAEKVRADLGWRPTHPTLVEEFRTGSYRG